MKIYKKFLIIFLFLLLLIKPSFCDDFESNEINDISFKKTYDTSTNSKSINTFSKNIIAIDRKTLTVLYDKNAYQKTAMASTTKIMTCIVALENSSLSEKVKISKSSVNVTGSCLGLKENSEIVMNDLLYGLMLRSGNDCAIAIAEHISGNVQNYIDLMNNKALDIGLSNTHFSTPHGLDDENHYTTAYDLAILTNYALNNQMFRQIVSTQNYTIVLNGNSKNIINTNELLNYDGIYGVKTGFTFNAGRCLVTSYKNNDFDIIIVVLGANTKKIRGQDTLNIINYIMSNYKYIDISSIIQESFDNYNENFLNTLFLEKTQDKPIIRLDDDFEHSLPLKTDGTLKLETKIYMPNKLSPKIGIDKPIGKLYVYNNSTLLSDIDIYLENKLKRNSWKYYFKYFLNCYKYLSTFNI